MTVSEKVAHLRGLAEGMEIEKSESKEAKLLLAVIDTIEYVSMALNDLEDNDIAIGDELDAMGEELDAISDDLSDVEDVVFEDEDEEDDEDWDEEDDAYYSVKCPGCGEEIVIGESVLEDGSLPCPNCGAELEFDGIIDEDEAEDEE